MRSLSSRIKKIEKALNANKRAQELRLVIYKEYPGPEPPENVENKAAWEHQLVESLGPPEEWLTVKAQMEAAEKTRAERVKQNPHERLDFNIIEIRLEPCAELEARGRQKATKTNKIAEIKAEK